MASSVFRELFEHAAEISGRSFPSEEVARQSLDAFRKVVSRESTPVESAMRRVFGHASVREVGGGGGERAFKIFLRSEPASDSMASVIRGLRSGDLESVARAVNIAPTDLGTRGFRKNFANYARDVFPDARVAEQLAAAERALPASVARSAGKLRPESADQLLRAIEGDRELKRLVTRLSEHIGKNGGSRFRYASTFFTLTGVAGGVGAVALALHEQAKRAAGCWRVYLDPITRELRSCKILHASCRNKEANEGAVCDRTPVSFSADMCSGAAPDDECARCSPSADPASNQHIAKNEYLDPNDLYLCRPVASIGEMLGRVIADVPDLARDVAIDVVGTVSRLWDGVKYFLLAAAGLFLVGFALYVYLNVKRVVAEDAAGDGERDKRDGDMQRHWERVSTTEQDRLRLIH